jgi:glucan phosphoethanolaminetransferase (alkaline phosphatase superfamily)
MFVVRGLWRFRWLILFNLFLISPLAMYEAQLGRDLDFAPDKILLFAIPASILWLALVQILVRRQDLAHALLFPFYLLVAVDHYMIREYQSRLTSSMFAVVLENWSDAGAYLRSNASPISIALLSLLVPYAIGIWRMRNLVIPLPRSWAWAPIGLLVLLYGAVTVKQTRAAHWNFAAGWRDVISHDRNSPFAIFPQGFTAWQVNRAQRDAALLTSSFSFGATKSIVVDEPETFVLVIGESSRPDHWSLYGYSRDTTPRLRAEPNLIVFRDAVTPASLSQISVPLILTRADLKTREMGPPEKSVISAFNEVEFRSAWLSTQQRDQWSGQLDRYSIEADSRRFFERTHDGVLVKALADMLASRPSAAQNQFVVIHTSGNHFVYSDRYPAEMAIFDGKPRSTGSDADLTDSYDNAVFYTDHMLTGIIAELKKRPGLSAMLYVSDHGENLMDDDRKLFGHFYGTEYDLRVPLIFWYSSSFALKFPEKVAAARVNSARRVTTAAVFHTLLDAAGITVHDERTATRSLLSRAFAEEPRWVLRNSERIDFDNELKKVATDQ